MFLIGPPPLDPILDYAVSAWRREPEMRAEDAYKWLFHAILGGEHAVQGEEGPRQWLDNEWPTLMAPKFGEPEMVRLRPDGKVIRVNLRPYCKQGGDKEMLLAVFVASAREFHADKREFVREWDHLGIWLRSHSVGSINLAAWRRVDAVARPRSFPAIDHSADYEQARHPAYRVILRSLWVPTK